MKDIKGDPDTNNLGEVSGFSMSFATNGIIVVCRGNSTIKGNADTVGVQENNGTVEVNGNADTVTVGESNGTVTVEGNSDTVNVAENNGTVDVNGNDNGIVDDADVNITENKDGTVNVNGNDGNVNVASDGSGGMQGNVTSGGCRRSCSTIHERGVE